MSLVYALLIPALWFAGSATAAVMVAMQDPGAGLGVLLTLCLPFTLITATIALWRTRFTRFTLTNKRVTVKTGVVLRRSREILLSKIESVEVRRNPIGALTDYGTIAVQGTGGGESNGLQGSFTRPSSAARCSSRLKPRNPTVRPPRFHGPACRAR
jgi:uncharacterized membrane protein YdbT with pleckstrin-like domain